jgi:hypothetical protein
MGRSRRGEVTWVSNAASISKNAASKEMLHRGGVASNLPHENEHIIRPCKLSHFTLCGGWKSGAAFATHAGDRHIMQVCHLHMQKSHLRKNADALVSRANQSDHSCGPPARRIG